MTTIPRPSVGAPALEELRALLGDRGVITDPERLLAYESDALTTIRGQPLAVVFPTGRDDLVEVLRVLYRKRMPFVPRGAGTGLAGGAVADGTVIVSTSRLNRIVSVDPADRVAVVEPGVVTADISAAAAPYGLHYLPDPGSATACTIGGNVAQNAGGPHCLRHGVTSDHIVSLEVVMADGSVVSLDRGGDGGLDLAGLLVGSEGTLGIASRITVRLVPRPECVTTALALFDSVEAAGSAVNGVFRAGIVPVALELIDRATIRVVEQSVFAAGLPTDAAAALIVECEGDEIGAEAELTVAIEALRAAGARQVTRAEDDIAREKMWQARKKAYGALGRLAPDVLVQDAVVPRTRLSELLGAIGKVANEHALPLANFFHAGDGNLHPNLMFDAADPAQVERVEAAGAEIMRLCVEAGGTITGEHGVGLDKRRYMELMFAPEELAALWSIKEELDPHGLCNPGKMLPDAPRSGHRTGRRWEGAAEAPEPASSGPAIRAAVLEHRPDDLTVRAGAGIRMRELVAYLEERGQWLPIAPLAPDRSLGGWVATADPHPSDHAYGTVRRQLLSCEVLGFDGRALPYGRPLVKNVAGYDLPRLACGSRGRLGVITEATLRLWPCPAERRLYAISAASWELRLAGELALGAARAGEGGGAAHAANLPFEPELLSWEEAPADGTGQLLVGLHGSKASVEARERRLADWVDRRGAELRRVSKYESLSGAHAGASGDVEATSRDQRRVRLTAARSDFVRVAEAARGFLDRPDVREVLLTGYPASGILMCSYRLDDGGAAVSILEQLRSESGRITLCVELGGEAEHAAAEGRRPAGARELESRVLAALGGRRRQWQADYE